MFQLQICLKPKQRDLKSQADTAVTDRSDSSKMVSSRKPFVHNRILSFLCRVALCDMRCDKLCHWYVKALYQEVSDPPCRVERVVGLWPRTSAWSSTHGMGTVIWRLCSGTGWLEVPASAWQSLRHRHERQGSGRLSGRRTRSLASICQRLSDLHAHHDPRQTAEATFSHRRCFHLVRCRTHKEGIKPVEEMG